MEKNIAYTRFCRFLKEKGAYREFLKEFNNPSQKQIRIRWITKLNKSLPINNYSNIVEYCDKINNKSDIIDYAFKWEFTKNGYKFWSRLSYEWRNIYPIWERHFKII